MSDQPTYQTYQIVPGNNISLKIIIGNGNPGGSVIKPHGNTPPAPINVPATDTTAKNLGKGSDLVNNSIEIATTVVFLNSTNGIVSYELSGGVADQTFTPTTSSPLPSPVSGVLFHQYFQFVS